MLAAGIDPGDKTELWPGRTEPSIHDAHRKLVTALESVDREWYRAVNVVTPPPEAP